jgi:hypothetical protein
LLLIQCAGFVHELPSSNQAWKRIEELFQGTRSLSQIKQRLSILGNFRQNTDSVTLSWTADEVQIKLLLYHDYYIMKFNQIQFNNTIGQEII